MRPILAARLEETRPVLVLTRELVRPHLTRLTVAPITSTVRGLSTEIAVGKANGLDHDSVVSSDNIVTMPVMSPGRASWAICWTNKNRRWPARSTRPPISTDSSCRDRGAGLWLMGDTLALSLVAEVASPTGCSLPA
jgi:mRNA interferase MazF